MHVVEPAELIAADLYAGAIRAGRRLTFGDIECHLARLGAHPPRCSCGRCTLIPRVTAHWVYAIASGWQRQLRAAEMDAWS